MTAVAEAIDSTKVAAPAGRLAGKVALVTGGTRGIGLAVAKAYAREGAKLVIASRTPGELKAALDELQGLGASATGIKVDLRDAKAADALYTACIRAYGRIDVLVNNAAVVGPPRTSLANFSPEEWDRVMRTNLDAVFYLTRACLGIMIPSNSGSIINVSSGVAKKGRAGWGAYSVSKAALENFSEVLAEDVSKYNVRVNCINPGPVRTSMRASCFPAEDPMSLTAPEDMVNAFVYLACDASKGLTGQLLEAKDFIGRAF